MSQLLDDLQAAKAVISNPEHWCQGHTAETKAGEPCKATNPEAARWCALGAIAAVAEDRIGARSDARLALYGAIGNAFLAEFNDNHTHQEVLAAFDRAIALHQRGGDPE